MGHHFSTFFTTFIEKGCAWNGIEMVFGESVYMAQICWYLLNIAGQPKIWVMMSWSTLSQMFANRQIINAETGDMFLDYISLLSDRLTFTRAAELEFTKAIYDVRIIKTPLYMKNKAGYLGRSSWSAVTEVRNKLGNLMLTTTNKMIIVDKVTRKPTSIAQWYREKHGHKFKGKQLKFDPITRPNTFTHLSVSQVLNSQVMWCISWVFYWLNVQQWKSRWSHARLWLIRNLRRPRSGD